MAITTQSGHRFVAKAALEPVYGGDGNLTGDGRWDYQWDGENRLTVMTTSTIAQTAGVPYQRLVFSYDGQGRRVRKQVFDSPTGAAIDDLRFLYDGWNLLIEYRKTGSSAPAVLRSYLWGQDLAGIDFSGQPTQGTGGVGGLLGVTTGGNSYLPAYDGNGNIVAWLNSSNQLVCKQEYDPFGNRIIHEGSVDLPIGFSTKYRDEETNLLYYGYRYYDPVTGRWPSRDPIEEAGGVNLYGMVNNKIVDKTDYLGMTVIWHLKYYLPFSGKVRHGGYFAKLDSNLKRILKNLDVTLLTDIGMVADQNKTWFSYANFLEVVTYAGGETSLEYIRNHKTNALNPVLITDKFSLGGYTYLNPNLGIIVEAQEDPVRTARIIAHELFHRESKFAHGNHPFDKKPYLTANPENLEEYDKSEKEKVACAVANWLKSIGANPDPKYVEKGWNSSN